LLNGSVGEFRLIMQTNFAIIFALSVKTMKKIARLGLPFFTLLAACGQPGPLYLPTDKPPIYVQPQEQQKPGPTPEATPAPAQETKPVPQIDGTPPATDQ
jgi:predicted small lipoprotein YifL